jgi:hypothetical protein
MRIITVLLIIWLLVSHTMAQPHEDNFFLSTGNAVTVDAEGFIYIAGSIITNLVFGPTRDEDVFLAKHDPHGNLLWREQFGTPRVERVAALAMDAEGYLYLLGDTRGPLASTSPGTVNLYLTKWTPDGEQLWVQQVNDYSARNLQLNTPEGITVTTAVMDEHHSVGYAILTFDPHGQHLSTTQPLNKDNAGHNTMLVTPDGDIFTTGHRMNPEQFRGAMDQAGHVSMFDADGTIVWRNVYPGGSLIRDAVLTESGMSYVTGYSISSGFGERDYEPSSTGRDGSDAFLARYEANGRERWVKRFGAKAAYDGWGVVVDNAGDVVVAGLGNGDLGGPHQGLSDAFLVKYDSDGTQKWAQQFGTEHFDQALGVTVDAHDAIYVTGYLHTTWHHLRMNEGLDPRAGRFTFLAKYDPDGRQLWLQTFEMTRIQ